MVNIFRRQGTSQLQPAHFVRKVEVDPVEKIASEFFEVPSAPAIEATIDVTAGAASSAMVAVQEFQATISNAAAKPSMEAVAIQSFLGTVETIAGAASSQAEASQEFIATIATTAAPASMSAEMLVEEPAVEPPVEEQLVVSGGFFSRRIRKWKRKVESTRQVPPISATITMKAAPASAGIVMYVGEAPEIVPEAPPVVAVIRMVAAPARMRSVVVFKPYVDEEEEELLLLLRKVS